MLLASERASISKLDREQLAAALRRLGEDVPPDASRAALLQRLAARRLAERARVVRLPLRLTFAGRRSSRRYLTVPVDVGDIGFVDFLLEAGAYQCLISAELRARLGMGPGDGAAVRALDSSGPTLRQRVELPDMWLGTFKLPQLSACVSDLPVPRKARRQPGTAGAAAQPPTPKPPRGAPAAAPPPPPQQQGPGGMLGVRALRCFDIDIDWAGNRLVFHPAGHAAAGLLDVRGLKRVPCQFTKSGLVILSVSINGSDPILGVLDLSAGVSILNWEAAELLGMRCKVDGGGGGGGGEEGGGGGGGEASSSGGGGEGGGGGGGRGGGARGPGYGAGHFGSIRVRPFEQLLLDRPAAGAGAGADAGAVHGRPPLIRLAPMAEEGLRGGAAAAAPRPPRRPPRAPGGGGGGLPALVQYHEAAEGDVRIVLGAGARGGGAAVPPPPKLAVAHLKGLDQVGLGGRPAVVVGGDVWGRTRMVLCLKGGAMYL
ncbi:MAG: hypothetical protein J3K34DRAFT_514145 [Monoraphidium minutum]|nr:MAG: hypothetical protein J3K34DRAFT_514145 [Monoraphidium minutum]